MMLFLLYNIVGDIMFRKMRRFKQQLSNDDCIELLKKEKRAVLSVISDNGYPYGIPINFYYDEIENSIYFHSAKEGEKIDSIKSNPNVCITLYSNSHQKEGDWAYYVKSVIAFGKASFLTDLNEAYKKAKLFGLKYYPNEHDVDIELEKDFSRVLIVKIEIMHITGKLVHEK